jgi:very-short-patch-repair endonuclease
MAKSLTPESTAADTGEHAEVSKLYHDFITRLAKKNILLVHKHAESPIERIYLCALALGFLMNDPLAAHFTPPLNDGFRSIEMFRNNHRARIGLKKSFEDQSGDTSLKGFLAALRRASPSMESEIESLEAKFLVYDMFHLDKAYHFVPQARFPEIKVEGKSVRLDLLAFIPADPTFYLSIECDGYKYHSSRERFVNDRKRDRILQKYGISVMRFSGTEIWTDPVGVAAETFERLVKGCEARHAALD